jgi:hypothetical protein
MQNYHQLRGLRSKGYALLDTLLFFFFFFLVHTRGGEGFKLVTFALLDVVPAD